MTYNERIEAGSIEKIQLKVERIQMVERKEAFNMKKAQILLEEAWSQPGPKREGFTFAQAWLEADPKPKKTSRLRKGCVRLNLKQIPAKSLNTLIQGSTES